MIKLAIRSCIRFHNILRLTDVLPNFLLPQAKRWAITYIRGIYELSQDPFYRNHSIRHTTHQDRMRRHARTICTEAATGGAP